MTNFIIMIIVMATAVLASTTQNLYLPDNYQTTMTAKSKLSSFILFYSILSLTNSTQSPKNLCLPDCNVQVHCCDNIRPEMYNVDVLLVYTPLLVYNSKASVCEPHYSPLLPFVRILQRATVPHLVRKDNFKPSC